MPRQRSGESREQYNARMAAYMKAWYDRRHAAAVAALGGHCAQCPETNDLQFDHIDPATKTMTIAKMWTASEVRFQAELAKCQLLCQPHHQAKTNREVYGETLCATGRGRWRCACDQCKAFRRAHHAQWRAERL